MAKKISMQQIADRLGVSKYTVSQALSGKPGVSPQTRQQIISMARTLGNRLPSAATAAEAPCPEAVPQRKLLISARRAPPRPAGP